MKLAKFVTLFTMYPCMILRGMTVCIFFQFNFYLLSNTPYLAVHWRQFIESAINKYWYETRTFSRQENDCHALSKYWCKKVSSWFTCHFARDCPLLIFREIIYFGFRFFKILLFGLTPDNKNFYSSVHIKNGALHIQQTGKSRKC